MNNGYINYANKIMDLKHAIGDIVYLKTDPQQLPGIITGYQTRGNCIIYLVSLMTNEYPLQDYEISTEKDQLLIMLTDSNNE